MVNPGNTDPPPRIRCRQIEEPDAEAIVDLLTRGFELRRTRRFWQDVLQRLRNRSTPADLPRYGYLLESAGVPVGAILQIFYTPPAGSGTDATPGTRCNVSSWYVEPEFRSYAPLLVSQALKQKNVTYLNISSAPHTRPIVQAQGYTRYSDGIFVAIPVLSRKPAGIRTRIIAAPAEPAAPFEPYERDLLQEHADYGCVSLWCETPERAHPFVFRTRVIKRVIACAQLIYCNDEQDFVRFARPLGLALAGRGWPLTIVDANGPVAGLVGKYFADIMPRYFKGPKRPRLGDLAYTETAMFGV
jgi:hypothetical protein